MQTGLYIYTDKTASHRFNADKKLLGIFCRITEITSIVIKPIETPRKLKWEEAQAFCAMFDCKAPTRRELCGIWLNKQAINKKLTTAGLPEIKDEFYWAADTSSEKLSYGLNMANGIAGEINARGRCLIIPIIPLFTPPHSKERYKMDTNSKALENLAVIRQILEQSKMNPNFEQIDLIYKKTEISNDNQ